jgi:hypothetical protein
LDRRLTLKQLALLNRLSRLAGRHPLLLVGTIQTRFHLEDPVPQLPSGLPQVPCYLDRLAEEALCADVLEGPSAVALKDEVLRNVKNSAVDIGAIKNLLN